MTYKNQIRKHIPINSLVYTQTHKTVKLVQRHVPGFCSLSPPYGWVGVPTLTRATSSLHLITLYLNSHSRQKFIIKLLNPTFSAHIGITHPSQCIKKVLCFFCEKPQKKLCSWWLSKEYTFSSTTLLIMCLSRNSDIDHFIPTLWPCHLHRCSILMFSHHILLGTLWTLHDQIPTCSTGICAKPWLAYVLWCSIMQLLHFLYKKKKDNLEILQNYTQSMSYHNIRKISISCT